MKTSVRGNRSGCDGTAFSLAVVLLMALSAVLFSVSALVYAEYRSVSVRYERFYAQEAVHEVD